MTVKNIIKTLSIYTPETEVKMASSPFISEIIGIQPVKDIFSNKTCMCIYGDEDDIARYEKYKVFYSKRTQD